MATVHPFEKAGLGKAPFRCIGCQENRFAMADGTSKPGGCCNFCFTGILYEYVIRGADGSQFVVGSDCVMKTGQPVDGFKEIRQQVVRERRQQGAKVRREIREAQWAKERAERKALKAATWEATHAALGETLRTYDGSNQFLLSMKASLVEWGNLTDGQVAAVHRTMAGEAQRELSRKNSKHIGYIGDRIKGLKARVTKSLMIDSFRINGHMIYKYLVKLETETGDQLVWWTGNHHEPTADFGIVSLTVKDHGEFDGTKQTTVQRVKFN